MRQPARPAPPAARDLALILLALAAGCVDGVSFLGLGQVLTAAMTGNTVLLGLALGQAELQAAHRCACALLGFFCGILLGAAIVGPRAGSCAMAAALAIELLALVAVALGWQLAEGGAHWVEVRLLLIAAAGLAMGIQSALAHRTGVAGIATTYVTGTLTTLAARLVDRFRRGAAPPAGRLSTSWLPALVWLAYGAGAAFAGAARLLWPGMPSAALALPIVIVATLALRAALGPRGGAAG